MSVHTERFPFLKDDELCSDLDDNKRVLPGCFPISLDDQGSLHQFLEDDLRAHELESVAHRLWILSTESGANINPLHKQKVKGRAIVVTEEPRLHLLWFHDRIFIKPLPRYLLCHAFWHAEPHLKPDTRKAALGFLRTYRHLIRYPSDLAIAQREDLQLIPKNIKWEDFYRLFARLGDVSDMDVSKRYSYGEIRLSRLNYYAPFLLGKLHYEQLHGQYSDYFTRLYGPILFIFAVISILLNAMQVGLTAEQLVSSGWESFWRFCKYFSVVVLVIVGLVTLAFITLWLRMFLDEWIFALRQRRKKSREQARHEKQSSDGAGP